jgi:hypothetical protein
MSLFAPVLVTGFNRPDLLEEQLRLLIKTGCDIYVSLDVPREVDVVNAEPSGKCISIVESLRNELVAVRVSPHNLGAFRGITEAITWGFGFEKEFIILEDDVRVNEIFLSFATKMLMHYELDQSVGSIAGTNFVPERFITRREDSVRFSAFTSSWGWATWRDRWADYLQDLDSFPSQDFTFPENFWRWTSKRYWKKVFQDTANGKYDAWDYRWLSSNWMRRRLTLVPNSNLVVNVGFGVGATHTQDSKLPWWLPRTIENSFEVSAIPLRVEVDEKADRWTEDNHYRTKLIQQLRGECSASFPRSAEVYRRLARRTQ